MSTPGEINSALREGYRLAVHDFHFPFNRIDRATGATEVVHAVVDHGARAVFCSKEFAEKLPKEGA